jgi:hypothetical protein
MKHLISLVTLIIILGSCSKETENIPILTSISPLSGGYNTLLTIYGTNFSSNKEDNVVMIDNSQAKVESCSPTQLTVRVPLLDEGEVSVRIAIKHRMSESRKFKYIYTVHAAGAEMNSSGTYMARYWKNGVSLFFNDNKTLAELNGIAVVDTNVYVVGARIGVAKYWKNGVENLLTTKTSGTGANGICVKDNDVYIAGYQWNGAKDEAIYWKNGTVTTLTNGRLEATAMYVFVNGSDVYVGGIENSIAKYWKNGVAADLFVYDWLLGGFAMVFSNSTLHCVGTSNNVIKYWKNGNETTISSSVVSGKAVAMAIDGDDVYVLGYLVNAGTSYDIACYWKNGVMYPLSDGSKQVSVTSIVVKKEIVFVGGFGLNSQWNTVARYWKNGVVKDMSDGTHNAYVKAIAVQ